MQGCRSMVLLSCLTLHRKVAGLRACNRRDSCPPSLSSFGVGVQRFRTEANEGNEGGSASWFTSADLREFVSRVRADFFWCVWRV